MRTVRLPILALLATLAGLLWADLAARAQSYLGEPRPSYNLFIIGDALAGGLWAGMDRQLRGDARLKVSGRYKEDSGLARPEIYNWLEALPKIFESQKIDIAVVMIGSNDGQEMRLGSTRAAFGSPEWISTYKAAVGAMLDIFKDRGTALYWVGLPPMALPDNDREARTISELAAEMLKERGIRFIDVRPPFSRPDGTYTDSGVDNAGQFVRLRSKNGVNFLKVGNDKLAKVVLDAVRADVAESDRGGSSEAQQAPTTSDKADQQEIHTGAPIFGQGLVSGEAENVDMSALPPVGSVAVTRERKESQIASQSAAEAEALAPGSSAAALYSSGRWPAVKPGRIDDFSVKGK